MTHSNQNTSTLTNTKTATKVLPLETKAQSKNDNVKRKITRKKPMVDLYQSVTDSIVASLEKGVKPWVCPWEMSGCSQMPFSFKSKASYSGVNVLLLWSAATINNYKSPAWLTYKQAAEMGGQVKKGEKGTQIIFYKQYTVKETLTEAEKNIPMLKSFTVFNLDQIDGIEIDQPESEALDLTEFEQYKHVDEVINATGAKITEMGDQAFFRPSTDEIYIPPRETFKTVADFYATTLHELTHWTGHKSRLNRVSHKKHGDSAYAFEELIAELGSAFLMSDLGVDGDVQHDSYIASWLKALKSDKKFIFQAASQASKAHKLITE